MPITKIAKLEKEIKSKMTAIQEGTLTPKESGIGKLFTALLDKDEASHEALVKEYKAILNARK